MDAAQDEMLLATLRQRLEESRIAMDNLRAMTKNLERVNERLLRSEELRSNFLSNVRNEINNPLASILGLTRQIAEGRADVETARSMAGAAYQEAFELDFQIRNIFAAAELEAGDSSLGVARTDVAELLRGLVADHGRRAGERHVEVSVRCGVSGGKELLFATDPEKLRTVLANLVANAMEHAKERSVVSIHAGREGRTLGITVSDQGPGIPAVDQRRIFDRFVQLDTGARKQHRGHGLGLSIVKAYAEMLGGSIALTCPPAGGCVFTLTIPELQAEGADATISRDGNEFLFGQGEGS